MKTKTLLSLLSLALLIVGSVWIVKFRAGATLRSTEGAIFGTYYHIKYEATESLDSQIVATLQQVDASMSVFNPQSTLSSINQGRTDKADAMLYEVLTKAREVSEATDGSFDVTVMPLVNAWGFGFKHGAMPDAAAVDSLRALVGYTRLTLGPDSTVHRADPRMSIDCGAIAKGYGVDRVARLLANHGVRNFMVEIGGEVVVKGRNPNGHKWQIGVSKPVEGDSVQGEALQTILALENCALATSGNYRNYYIKDGRKYAHTIDPRSGRPVQHSLLSATVIAPDCTTADAYATAFMVMGMEQAEQVLAKNRSLRAYFIYADGEGRMQVKGIRM